MKKAAKAKKKKSALYECGECGDTAVKSKRCCGKAMKKGK